MVAAGMVVEDSKGECNFGQHEINFHYADALRTADEHVVYKNGAKEIAAEEGMAITFMAKYDEREGNSCHIHFSLADSEGPLFARDESLFHSFLAGQLACLREMTLLLAPHINSYKRYAAAQFRADHGRLGSRQPHVLAARSGPRPVAALREPRGRRRPEPVPCAERADRLWAARDRCGPRAGAARSRAAPTPRASARACRRHCTTRAGCSPRATSHGQAFGEDVVAHYLNAADVELASFQSAVTDWERVRGFERL